ncbi:uncharacterized protein LOC142537464 [Primulina tabacum]|uniref:uncharacterized protein LOC142537464 n=1 Tax=Primulina tabacum TaxID=48773 RepID=UPI003F597646
MTARCLRPYFLSHPVVILTNSPLGRILTHSDMSGRVVKWTTELGEYDIHYEPRTAIKAQDLADFLAKPCIKKWDGVVLISSAGDEVKLAIRLDFRASNNEAEYEAMLAGLRATVNLGATQVLVFSDSQLVAQHMKEVYDVKDEKLIYAQEVDKVRENFTEVAFEQIPRKENEKTDILAKMAGTMGSSKTRHVVFQVELAPHTSSLAVEKEEEDWRTVIISYLKEGKLPDDPWEARKLKIKCSRYVVVAEVLYRRSFTGLLLRCLSYKEADYVLRDVHEGCCGNHLGAYVLARKVLLAGYCWPSVLHEVQKLVMSCDSCQRHARLHHQPAALMKTIIAACPFDQCGIDIVGPFPIAPAQEKYLLVVVNYFSRCVEAEPLARITENEVLKFLWKNIVCRYRVLRRLISGNGRQSKELRSKSGAKR